MSAFAQKLAPRTDHGKSQQVRLLGVFLLGPFMVWAGYQLTEQRPIAGVVMGLAGLATVAYNANNYRRIRRRRAPR